MNSKLSLLAAWARSAVPVCLALITACAPAPTPPGPLVTYCGPETQTLVDDAAADLATLMGDPASQGRSFDDLVAAANQPEVGVGFNLIAHDGEHALVTLAPDCTVGSHFYWGADAVIFSRAGKHWPLGRVSFVREVHPLDDGWLLHVDLSFSSISGEGEGAIWHVLDTGDGWTAGVVTAYNWPFSLADLQLSDDQRRLDVRLTEAGTEGHTCRFPAADSRDVSATVLLDDTRTFERLGENLTYTRTSDSVSVREIRTDPNAPAIAVILSGDNLDRYCDI